MEWAIEAQFVDRERKVFRFFVDLAAGLEQGSVDGASVIVRVRGGTLLTLL